MIYNVTAPDGFDPLTNQFLVTAPDGFDPLVNQYLVHAPEIGVDPAKVLLIVNSDEVLSGQAADYYKAARNLNSHRLTYSLGTSDTTIGGTDGADPDTFYTNVVEPVANYIDANGIQAVILSARVPHLVDCKPDGASLQVATSSVLGSSRFIRDVEGGMVRSTDPTIVEPQVISQETGGWFYEPYQFNYSGSTTTLGNNSFLDFRDQRAVGLIPHGRLGLPKATALHPVETLTEVQRMIDDAVVSEGKGSSLGTIHFGLHDRSPEYVTGYQSEVARQDAAAAGVTTKHFRRTYSANWPEQPPADSYTYADANAGILNEDCFGLIGSCFENQDMSAAWPNSYNFLQGSWGFEATSFGYHLMGNVLNNGGCAATGTVDEPYSFGLCETHSLMRGLLAGRAFCEAVFFGRNRFPWMHDTWGDPLYAPFQKKVCRTCDEPNLIPNPNDMSSWTEPDSTVITPNAGVSPGCKSDANYVSLTAGDVPSQGLYTAVGTPNADVELSVWVKKITQTTTALCIEQSTTSTLGRWDIDFSAIGNDWEKLTEAHPAVSVVNSWKLDGSGNLWIDMHHLSGASPIEFYAWCWHAVEI